MKLIIALVFFVMATYASAQTLLECKPTQGDRETRETVIAEVLLDGAAASMVQYFPVFRNVKFDAKLTEREVNRRGSVVHYQVEIPFEEVITFSVVEAGKKRNAYLQMESVITAEVPFYEAVVLECSER